MAKQHNGFILLLTLITLTALSVTVITISHSILSARDNLIQQQVSNEQELQRLAQIRHIESQLETARFYQQVEHLVASGMYLSESFFIDFRLHIDCQQTPATINWHGFNGQFVEHPEYSTAAEFAVLTTGQTKKRDDYEIRFYTVLVKQCVLRPEDMGWLVNWHMYEIDEDQQVTHITSRAIKRT